MSIKILAVETATAACSAALLVADPQVLIQQHFRIAPQQHNVLLLKFLDRILKEFDYTVSDIDAMAVGCGPGSFMGVRIAVGVVQGLAYAQNIPVIPVSTLQALAWSGFHKSKQRLVMPGWDARLNGIYWGAYRIDDQQIPQVIVSDCLQSPDKIAMTDGQEWMAVGNAWQTYAQSFSGEFIRNINIYPELIYPDAKAIAHIGYKKYLQGQWMEAASVRPVYLRNVVAHPNTT